MSNVHHLNTKTARQNAKQKHLDESASIDTTDASNLLNDLGIKSFEQEYKKLSKAATGEDFSASKLRYALLRSQLAMAIHALPIAEAAFRKWKDERSAKALTAISGHVRELSHDIMAFGDQTELAERLHNDVTRRVLSSLATSLTSKLIAERQDLYAQTSNPKVKKRIETSFKKIQRDLQEYFKDADTLGKDALEKALKVQ